MSKAKIRTEVAARARGCCEYCRSQEGFSADTFSIEHIVPKKRFGSDDLSNLAFSCQGCNSIKHTRVSGVDPLTGETVALFHPREQKWNEHFSWSHDYSRIIGVTSTGRATVSLLQLNRPGVVSQRNVLAPLGKHPV